jgi:hypothetical protein
MMFDVRIIYQCEEDQRWNTNEKHKCWDQIVEGYLILNTGKNVKVSNTRWTIINALDSFPWGNPQGVYL